MAAPDPYARSVFHGRLLDNASIANLKLREAELGYELTIVQGIGGAAASGGTHLNGRAVDLTAYQHARKVQVLRDGGWAAWYRPALPGVWGEHVHAVLIFDGRDNRHGLAGAGFDQIDAYDRGLDGLAAARKDPNPYRPSPARGFSLADYRRTFETPTPRPAVTKVTRARDRLVESLHTLGQAAALLEDTADTRVRLHSVADHLRAERRAIRAQLDALPER